MESTSKETENSSTLTVCLVDFEYVSQNDDTSLQWLVGFDLGGCVLFQIPTEIEERDRKPKINRKFKCESGKKHFNECC